MIIKFNELRYLVDILDNFPEDKKATARCEFRKNFNLLDTFSMKEKSGKCDYSYVFGNTDG